MSYTQCKSLGEICQGGMPHAFTVSQSALSLCPNRKVFLNLYDLLQRKAYASGNGFLINALLKKVFCVFQGFLRGSVSKTILIAVLSAYPLKFFLIKFCQTHGCYLRFLS